MHLRINIDKPSACKALFIAQGQSSLPLSLPFFLSFSISLVLFSLPRPRFFSSSMHWGKYRNGFVLFVVAVSLFSSFSRRRVYRHFETEACTESKSTEANEKEIKGKALPPQYQSTDRHSWHMFETPMYLLSLTGSTEIETYFWVLASIDG